MDLAQLLRPLVVLNLPITGHATARVLLAFVVAGIAVVVKEQVKAFNELVANEEDTLLNELVLFFVLLHEFVIVFSFWLPGFPSVAVATFY